MSQVGTGVLYERKHLPKCFKQPITDDLGGFDFERFRRICILSGCDYLPVGLPGVGLAKAVKFFQGRRCNEEELDLVRENYDFFFLNLQILRRIPTYLNLNAKITMDFIADFKMAEYTFLHQIVYDPVDRQRVPLNPIP